MPRSGSRIPWSPPRKTIAMHKPACAADVRLLHDSVEAKPLRGIASSIAAREPDISPDDMRPACEVDLRTLVIATSGKRDGRAGEHDQHRVLVRIDVPLL